MERSLRTLPQIKENFLKPMHPHRLAEFSTDFGSKEDGNDVVVCSVSELLDGALNEQEWREACETDQDMKSVVHACRYKEGDVLGRARDALFDRTWNGVCWFECVVAVGVGSRCGRIGRE
ncbi:hypothetical protein NDU88_002430 [Pleurodeles waltl]|uniref:Uncharacterized protein n=1 Tax=Pleurodeles waltl TaxID=8319 RepID=A0AAV7NFD6_PLEWA|nr:hypothetical protein NDU88_002430 [Pleurodeles waltl]